MKSKMNNPCWLKYCHVGTSKSQLHKARARMRELLGPALAAERAAQRGEGGPGGPGVEDVEE